MTETDDRSFEDKPRWSPDGRTLYFLEPERVLESLGTAVRLGGHTAVGEAFQVSRFDSS